MKMIHPQKLLLFLTQENQDFTEKVRGFKLYFKRQTKIKVLKESYINNADYNIPLYKGSSGKEKIIKFKDL